MRLIQSGTRTERSSRGHSMARSPAQNQKALPVGLVSPGQQGKVPGQALVLQQRGGSAHGPFSHSSESLRSRPQLPVHPWPLRAVATGTQWQVRASHLKLGGKRDNGLGRGVPDRGRGLSGRPWRKGVDLTLSEGSFIRCKGCVPGAVQGEEGGKGTWSRGTPAHSVPVRKGASGLPEPGE